MADRKQAVRMHSPEDSSGERTDLFPITSTDEVIDTRTNQPLTESLDNMIVVSDTKPEHPAVWFDLSD
jgi:hypothetical protein